MADTQKIVSILRLNKYDTLIKQYINAADAKSIKTVLWDPTAEKIKFYKKENAALTDTADYEVAISSSDVATLKEQMAEVLDPDTGIEAVAKKYTDDELGKLDNNDAVVAGQFVTAAVQEDGKVTVSRKALEASDIPTLTLEKISDAGTAAAKDVATTAIAEDTTDASLVTAAQVAKFVQDEVADLEGATHFRGVVDSLDEITDPKAGDIAIVGVKEYIYTDKNAWKELGDETIYVTKTTTIAGVDLQNDITAEELRTALNVEDNAQENVLEGVQVNGTDLAITDKKVNVTVASGTANGSVAVNGVDVAVTGLKDAAFDEYATDDDIIALFAED